MLIYKDCLEETQVLQYVCDPCDITEGGGVRSLCLIKPGTTIPNPITQLDIDILVGAGLIYVMPETKGTFDGGTPKMIPGYGDKKERQIGADYVLQVKDLEFASNYAFWSMVENKEVWNVAFRTETQLAVVYSDCTITTKAPAEEAIDTEVAWNIEVKWYSKSKPEIQAYVAGVFDNILKTLDVIYGGTMPTGGVVKLTIDADKTGYIKLPNGTVLTTVAGVINTTYAGVGGAITYYVPKTSAIATISSSGISGDIIYNGNALLSAELCTNLTSVTANDVLVLDVSGSSLTAKSIGDILYNAYTNNVIPTFSFDAGNNALQGAVDTYLQATYAGLTYATVYARLVTLNGGTITIDTV